MVNMVNNNEINHLWKIRCFCLRPVIVLRCNKFAGRALALPLSLVSDNERNLAYYLYPLITAKTSG